MKHLEKMILVWSRLSFIKRKIMFQKTFVWCNKDKTLFSSVQIFLHCFNYQSFISSFGLQWAEPKPCFKKGTSFETWSLLSHTIILLQLFLLLIQDQPLPFLNSPLQTPKTLHFLRLSSRKSLSLRPCIMIICN